MTQILFQIVSTKKQRGLKSESWQLLEFKLKVTVGFSLSAIFHHHYINNYPGLSYH